MIRTGNGYHFLPAKELDMEYKIDMMSRLPISYNGRIHSIAFGTQITMANMNAPSIEDNKPLMPPLSRNKKRGYAPKSRTYHDTHSKPDHYNAKYQQIQSLIPFLENTQTKREISEKFGRIFIPDIISYTAINGKIRDTLNNEYNPTLRYFREWRKTNFEKEGLLDFFKPDFQECMHHIADAILEAQQYILHPIFLQQSKKRIKKDTRFGEDREYKKTFIYSTETGIANVSLKYRGEMIMKTSFFLTPHTFSLLRDIHEHANSLTA